MVKKNKANRAKNEKTTCGACNAAPGELHEAGCTAGPSQRTGAGSVGEGGPGPQSRPGAEMPAEPGREHETVLVREGDMEAEIDVKIAPLVREVWKAGIETNMSCQEDGFGLVWLEFPGEKELLSFLAIVVNRYEEGRDSVYNRSVGEFLPTGATPS